MKNEKEEIRDCIQCKYMREMIMTRKKGLKYEVYCDEDGQLKGRVKNVLDILIPDDCPLKTKKKKKSFITKIFRFLKM